MHHPWRVFGALTDWTLVWAELPPDTYGITDFTRQRVVLNLDLTQEERRCTIAHETQHVLHGPVPAHLTQREETRADRVASRLLLPDVRVVGDALAWSHNIVEAAYELWVDEPTLRARLNACHGWETLYLNKRLRADDAIV